ncbi:MAG: FAD-dependent oxidoreductase [Chloroflexi bacterium]|nr:MAG: FAD-dependent oxidoreductase [Chloroflexota bacterium]
MGNIGSMNRAAQIKYLQQNPDVSVLIIGTGINAVALFRELALQNIDAVLVNDQDFGTGSTLGVSHLVHGDIYYRENGGFQLVKNAVVERQRLLNNAPHIVKPLPTIVPIFRWVTGRFHIPIKLPQEADKTGRRGMFFTRLGLMLQDKFLESDGVSFKHQFAFRKKSLKQFPRLNPDILGTVSYYNATISAPERLCMDLLWDAYQSHSNAVALNHVQSINFEGNIVSLTDSIDNTTIQLLPKLVIEAQDCMNATETRKLHKWLHLVIEHPELRNIIGERSFFFEFEDGRFIRICAYHRRILLSTSHFTSDASPTDEPITVDDSLKMVQQLFPTLTVASSNILYQKSDCYPLAPDNSHQLHITKAGTRAQFPILHLQGGNWTTFRAKTAQIVDLVLEAFGKTRRQNTENMPIGGGKKYPRDRDERWRWLHKQSREYELAFEHVKLLFGRYGTRAREVAAYLATEPDAPLKYHADYTVREIAYLADLEQVAHLDDLILRRTCIGKLGEANADLVAEIGQIVSKTLGWSFERTQQEIERTFMMLVEEHGVALYQE